MRRKRWRSIRSCRWPIFLLGELYMYKSRMPEAIAEFQKELAINPAHAATYYKLADAYSRCRNTMRRSGCCSARSGLDATSQRAVHSDGEGAREKRRVTIWRLLALKHAVIMEPNNPTTHHLLGQAYRDMGKKEDAESGVEAGGRIADEREDIHQ